MQTTFNKELLDKDFDGKILVEVGDSKQSDFKPQAKLIRYDNKFNLSFRYIGSDIVGFSESSDKIISEHNNCTLELYDKPDKKAFELELIFNDKPVSNKFPFSIRSKGIDNWYYQSELTEEKISKGHKRPLDVIGSYALYGNNKKLFHLYRPHIIDNNGNESWGNFELDLENEIINVVIDQSFLDNAVYPIKIDPTIGYTSLPGTIGPVTTGGVAIFHMFESVSGTLNSFNIYASAFEENPVSFKGLVFENDGANNTPNTVIAVSNEVSLGTDTDMELRTVTISGTLPSTGNIHIGITSNNYLACGFDTISTYYSFANTVYSSPTTLTNVESDTDVFRVGMYIDYTETSSSFIPKYFIIN